MIGVGSGSRRPRPPNRACGSPAHGSPVGGFLIGIGSPVLRIAIMVNNPSTAKKTLVSLDAVTQRRQHALHSLRGFNSLPVRPVSLCVLSSPCGHYRRLLLALHRCDFHPSTFLPPVPRRSFALCASRGSSPLRYHEGSDSCTAHLRRRSPRLLRHTFLSFHLQPRGLPGHRFTHHASVTSEFRTSP